MKSNKMDTRWLLLLMIGQNKGCMKMGGFDPQTLDQDLWVMWDRSREEGVPSRFGRGIGMCPLIRLGNCGGRERGRELARRVRGSMKAAFRRGTAALSLLWFPVFFLFIVPLPVRLCPPLPPQQKEKSTLFLHKESGMVCVRLRWVCVCVFHK